MRDRSLYRDVKPDMYMPPFDIESVPDIDTHTLKAVQTRLIRQDAHFQTGKSNKERLKRHWFERASDYIPVISKVLRERELQKVRA